MTVGDRARSATLSALQPPSNGQANGALSMVRRVVAPAMVGRAAELELLATTVAAPPAVAVIDGEAGIGKTRLVTELAGRLELSGCRLVVGGCRRIREPFPLGPVIEAVRGLGEELAGVRFSPVVGALRPLLPELASWLPLAPESLDDRAAERHRVFRALVELLGAIGPAVLVLEDLHWADGQTVEFLGYLLAEEPAGLSVVLTYRGEEVDPGVRAVTARLPTSVGYASVALGPLDVEQTGRLAASILDTERISADLSAHLCVRASGVPLAVEELLALLRQRGTLTRHAGGWERKALDELDVPAGIRDPVLERVSGLSVNARGVVEAAAVLQEPVPVPVLAAVSHVAKSRTARAVAEALVSGLLVEKGNAVGFRHVLAAQAVYEALPGPRRTDLHARAVSALKGLDPVPFGQLAHHLRHGDRLDEWALAAQRAADQAVALGHDDEAARLFEDVLRRASLGADNRACLAVKLARTAVEAVHTSNDVIDLLSEVLTQELPHAALGELRFWLALLVDKTGGDATLERRLLWDAVGDLDDRPDLKAWAMVGLGIPLVVEVSLSEHKQWLKRALEILPNVDDPVVKVFLLGKIAMTLVLMGDPGWRELAERIQDQTGGTPGQRREVNAYYSVGMTACYAGDHQVADRMLSRALDGAVVCRDRRVELMIRSELALLSYCRGIWDGLGDTVDYLLDELADLPLARLDVEMVSGCLALAHGELDEASHRLKGVAQHVETSGVTDLSPVVFGALARLALARSEPDEAVECVNVLLTRLESKGIWAPIARALPTATQVLVAAGRGAEARALVTRASRELGELDVPLAPAALRHAQGILCAADKEWSDAVEHFVTADELYEPLECPYEAAQAREQAALALFEARDARAEETVRAALATYQRLGASWDVARCTQAARKHGVRLPAAPGGGRKGCGEALSPREDQVSRLAAEGRSNKAIAAELFLSPKTVDKHLGRAMRKLGVHSRAAIAARLPDYAPESE